MATVKDGYLVDEAGGQIQIDGRPVKVTGVFTQAELDGAVNNRLEREKTKHQTALDSLKAEYEDKLKGLGTPESIKEIQKRAEEAEAKVTQMTAQMRSERVRNDLLQHAANFIDPEDLIRSVDPGKVVWDDKTGAYKIKMPVTKDGKTEEQEMDAAGAAKLIAETKSHYVKGSNTGGSGASQGASFGGSFPGKRSEMTAAQKATFVAEKGLAAFQQLPD